MSAAKNTICIWYAKDAEAAARFYAATFPDSSVNAVHHAPGEHQFQGPAPADQLRQTLGPACARYQAQVDLRLPESRALEARADARAQLPQPLSTVLPELG